MADRKMPGVHNVRLKDVRELLKLPWVRDEELSDRWNDVRILSDGRVLCYLEHTSSTIFPSREAYAAFKQECEAEAAKPPLGPKTLLPPIDDFLRDVEAHAKSLAKVLRIPEEVLDGSEASLEAVDDALKRMRRAKRLTPEVITPLVAYVGEVMRPVCNGRWVKFPETQKKNVAVYDPAELAAWQARQQAKRAAAEKAKADVLERGGSAASAQKAWHNSVFGTYERLEPIRYNVVEEPIRGHENEPAIQASDGRLLQPFALVFVPMVEPSKRLPLRHAVDVTLLSYRRRPGNPPQS